MDSALNIPIVNLVYANTRYFLPSFLFLLFPGHQALTARYRYSQLKKSGGLEIIHKRTVLKAINELNSFYESILEFNQNIYNEHWNKLDEFAMQLIRLPSPPPGIDDPLYHSYPHNAEVFTRYDTPLIEQLYSFTQFEKSDLIIIIDNEKHYPRTKRSYQN